MNLTLRFYDIDDELVLYDVVTFGTDGRNFLVITSDKKVQKFKQSKVADVYVDLFQVD